MHQSVPVLPVLLITVLTACGGESAPPSPATSAPAAAPSTAPSSTDPAPEPMIAPTPAEPTALERAEVALGERRYDDACGYLVARGMSQVVCDWIAATARTNDDQALSVDRFERFLREQHVRRVSGSIVGWYDEAHNEYEARISGRTAILVATETEFETTGRFTMWAQERGSSDEVLESGREVSVPVYREWPLYDAIIEMARVRGADAGPAAIALLRELLRGWESDYCYTVDPEGGSECYVDPNLPLPGVTAPSAESAIAEIRALLPPTWDEHTIAPQVAAAATYLDEHALRYDQLAAFPTTRLATLRVDAEQRGNGWTASGTVVEVLSAADPPALVFWRGDTCTYAIVPNARAIANHASVRFAGVAVQPYRWRNLVGREQDCMVAVGYLAGR